MYNYRLFILETPVCVDDISYISIYLKYDLYKILGNRDLSKCTPTQFPLL